MLIEQSIFDPLVRVIMEEFGTPEGLLAWVQGNIPGHNAHNVVHGDKFIAQATNLLVWANADGIGMGLLQLLADNPPNASAKLQSILNFLTRGQIRPSLSELPPVLPHERLMVTSRPFANRFPLRDKLQRLAAAGPGADSVLIIEGKQRSGKSYGVRLALQCGPPTSREVDFGTWGSDQVFVWDLAQAIYPQASHELNARKFDPTKEDAEVPWLFNWLSGKLHPGPPTWILLDHCNRATISRASGALLFKLAQAVERGALPEVRLVLADIAPTSLPAELHKNKNRWDTAGLPDRAAVLDWCKKVAAGLQALGRLAKPCTPEQIDSWVESVFAPTADGETFVDVLEPRLRDVYEEMRAH
jgi:hypothetical protein